MIFQPLPIQNFLTTMMQRCRWQIFLSYCLAFILILSSGLLIGTSPAFAGINDDNFEGNIYALYGGNGSLVPARVTLTDSLSRPERATAIVFYLDDSSDCKQFTTVVSRLQAFYGRAVDIIPINTDSIPLQDTYKPTEVGYYYHGVVPETVILDQSGNVVLDAKGQVAYEKIDDVLRKVFNLLPRTESIELKRRSFNEFNTELSQ